MQRMISGLDRPSVVRRATYAFVGSWLPIRLVRESLNRRGLLRSTELSGGTR